MGAHMKPTPAVAIDFATASATDVELDAERAEHIRGARQ